MSVLKNLALHPRQPEPVLKGNYMADPHYIMESILPFLKKSLSEVAFSSRLSGLAAESNRNYV